MAIDSRNKRSCTIGAARPWMVRMPNPSGTIPASARQHTAYTYCGIAAVVDDTVEVVNIICSHFHNVQVQPGAIIGDLAVHSGGKLSDVRIEGNFVKRD